MSPRDLVAEEGSSARATERRKRRLRLYREKPQTIERRRFFAQGAALSVLGLGVSRFLPPTISSRVLKSGTTAAPIRPPSALAAEADFQTACTRCGLCGVVCENGCIRFFGADENEHGGLTPYIDVRSRSCTLCMRCTEICPTGALSPIKDDLKVIAQEVRMGKAVVDPEHCLSYMGRICGYCHDACPIPETSIKLTAPALPVILDDCVGCGRCVEECPQSPTAIRIERREA